MTLETSPLVVIIGLLALSGASLGLIRIAIRWRRLG